MEKHWPVHYDINLTMCKQETRRYSLNPTRFAA
jgi:hypothetical protein